MFAYPCFEEFFSLYIIRISFAATCFHCLSPFAVPPWKAFSVTILHIFEDSNDISPSPFLIKAEQTSHLSALVHHALQPSFTELIAARALLLSGKLKWDTLLQPETLTSLTVVKQRGTITFFNLLDNPLANPALCRDLGENSTTRSYIIPVIRGTAVPGIHSLNGEEVLPCCLENLLSQPHPSLCCPQGTKLGNTYLAAKGSMWRVSPLWHLTQNGCC